VRIKCEICVAGLRLPIAAHQSRSDTRSQQRLRRDLGLGVVDELIDLDPDDTRHLFGEELRRISLALRQVTPDDIDGKILEDFLSASDQLSNLLTRVEKRCQLDIKSRQ
jgi:hypothetical protein